MRQRNRLALLPASRVLAGVVYLVVLAPALGLLHLFGIQSRSLVLATFVGAGIVALLLTGLIERILRRWFFL